MSDNATRYVRIYADADGESHFDDVEVALSPTNYAPPALPLEVSAAVDAERFVFVEGASGWEGDWHPSPKRQFVFMLRGVVEVRVSDGEGRSFGPGSVVLMEDTVGRGHFSRIKSEESSLMAMVHLARSARGDGLGCAAQTGGQTARR